MAYPGIRKAGEMFTLPGILGAAVDHQRKVEERPSLGPIQSGVSERWPNQQLKGRGLDGDFGGYVGGDGKKYAKAYMNFLETGPFGLMSTADNSSEAS